MFPNAPVCYDNPVGPGEAMSASVVADGGGAFTLTLTDSTRGGTGIVLPLSDFGTVRFTGVTADNTAIGNENPSAPGRHPRPRRLEPPRRQARAAGRAGIITTTGSAADRVTGDGYPARAALEGVRVQRGSGAR